MSSKFLGESFDIHGGGKDLIFPHHENEIAQSEAAFEKRFATYWVHNGFVNIDQEKMSKSLGNFMLIQDVLKAYHSEAIRLFLLSNHYRSPIDFSEKSMDEATTGLDKIYAALDRLDNCEYLKNGKSSEKTGEFWEKFCEAMNDDFNTAKGIGILFETIKYTNRLLDENKNNPNSVRQLLSVKKEIEKMGEILGILFENPHSYFNNKKSSAMEKTSVHSDRIEEMIREREAARKAKDWEMNIILEDRPDGTVWKISKT